MNKKIIFIAAASFIPAFAQAATLQTFIAVVGNIAGLAAAALVSLAFVAFFYGLAIYALNSGNDEKKEQGRGIMIWGTIAIFVLVTIWGIIGFLQRTVGNTEGPGQVDIIVPRL